LFDKELVKPEDLADLAQILEMKASSKGSNMLYLLSLTGIFFLPIWSEYVSWNGIV